MGTDDPHGELRELWYGDVALRQWAGPADGERPWSSFQAAVAAIDSGDPSAARVSLHEVLDAPGLESRQYLQAWHALRELGEQPPPEEASRLYGVVVDVPMPEGRDTLAAYADHTCRYLNYSGSAIIWDIPDPTVEALVDQLLGICQSIVDQIGPWEGDRPPLPPGQARLSLLCPNGLSFGQADLDTLMSDPMAASAFSVAAQLLSELTSRSSGA